MRAIACLALAAGAMLVGAPANAIPLTGGVSQGYSDYLKDTIIEVRRGGHHGHHARGGHGHRHFARHHHRHFAFRIHRRHHARGWHDPCPYGYVLEYGRCVPYVTVR